MSESRNQSREYTPHEVRECALQMYKELVWVQGSHGGGIIVAKGTLNLWRTRYDFMVSEFREAFPEGDPKLCELAQQYILDHEAEMMTLATQARTEIHIEDSDRFGFKSRVVETLSAEGDAGVDFVSGKGNAN